jgi:hypothetical protein
MVEYLHPAVAVVVDKYEVIVCRQSGWLSELSGRLPLSPDQPNEPAPEVGHYNRVLLDVCNVDTIAHHDHIHRLGQENTVRFHRVAHHEVRLHRNGICAVEIDGNLLTAPKRFGQIGFDEVVMLRPWVRTTG